MSPLDNLLVVSLEQAVAAPFCSSRLADAGARVIKVEREGGDFARAYDEVVHGESGYFVWLNRGKESLVLDIKNPQDAALLQRILAKADVFIQNLAPGAAARAGFASELLRKAYPRLITCDISGYGQQGGYAQMKAYDMLVQAESGMCSITGSPEQPGRIGVSACDVACGMYSYMAILEAIIARERTGEGRAIRTSMFDCMADWMTVPLLLHDYTGKGPKRTGLSHPMIQPYGAYETRGGRPILIAVQNEREFMRLCDNVLEQPDLKTDPRFSSNPARVKNVDALREVINSVFTGYERADLIERLRAAEIAFGEINDVAGLSQHPALRRVEVGTPTGPVTLVAPPAQTDGDAPTLGPVPALGAHSAAIRAEFSGG
ncbi:MAG: CoA transferase [Gammaproteobacteria bacterium]|nr:CoA transferase [Gammaproteobacteria bacterium]MDH3412637.1 CoA transferase [Gammaproteobacteria bacterium]